METTLRAQKRNGKPKPIQKTKTEGVKAGERRDFTTEDTESTEGG